MLKRCITSVLAPVLALGTPPQQVVAVLCFVIAAILAWVPEPRASRWWPVFLSVGLAAHVWPW